MKDKIEIYKKAKKIVESDLSWEEKYDLIFSENISKQFELDYYDPATSYEEDVMAFMNALDEYMNKFLKIETMDENIKYLICQSIILNTNNSKDVGLSHIIRIVLAKSEEEAIGKFIIETTNIHNDCRKLNPGLTKLDDINVIE